MSRAEKGGKTNEGHIRQRHSAQDPRVQEGHRQQVEDIKGGKRREEPWKLSCGGDVKVDGCSVPDRVGGEKRLQLREAKRRQTVTDGGTIGCRCENKYISITRL